jgi:DNA-entry nuclease
MRPFEEETEHYIWNTGNHVLYMVKPWFSGDELVARGVQMTAKSVEDGGKGISFNIYLFNVTPGADIDYNSGIVTTEEQASQGARLYVLNRRSGVFHYPSCDGAKDISPKNREEVTATRSELTAKGYVPCGLCEP